MNLELEQIYQSDGNIDIVKVIKIVWSKWLFIVVFSFFFSMGSIFYALSLDPVTGEKHLRHHMTKDGFFKGRKILDIKTKEDSTEDSPS